MCDALAEAHRAGVVHRDIKPQNIFLTNSGRIKLMDFGVSRLRTLPSFTTGGQLIGTPKYMSPEQVHHKSEVDHRSDIYSLGIVLYELSTRHAPFEGRSTLETAMKQVQEEPLEPTKLNPNLPKSLEALILKCMSKDPAGRFQSATELREELQTIPSTYQGETLVENVADLLDMRDTAKAPREPPTAVVSEAHGSEGRTRTTIRKKRPRGLKIPVAIALSLVVVTVFAVIVHLRRAPATVPVDEESSAVDEIVLPSIPPNEDEVGLGAETNAPAAEDVSSEAPSSSALAASPSIPREPAVVEGRLTIESVPPGATVHVDGRSVGKTPWNGSLPAGVKRVAVSAPGFVTAEDTLEISAGASVSRRIRLTPVVTNVVVRLSANPETQIYVDDVLLGSIPPIIEKELTVGEHHVRYVMPGYAEHEETIEVTAQGGGEFAHQFPIPGAVRVIAQPYARVLLDGRDLGFTPVRLEKVSEGEHQLVLEREGFQRIEQTITVKPFEVNRFQFELTELTPR
jgi:hypothetical protein